MIGLRTSRSSITFAAPVHLSAFTGALPAGTYDVDTEEEVVVGDDRTVSVRVLTLIHVRTAGQVRIVAVDPYELHSVAATGVC